MFLKLRKIYFRKRDENTIFLTYYNIMINSQSNTARLIGRGNTHAFKIGQGEK